MIPVLILATAFPSHAQSPPSLIATRNHRAASLLFLRFEPVQSLLPKGKSELSLSYVNANHFTVGRVNRRLTTLEDFEDSRLQIRFRKETGDFEVSLGVPFTVRGGGYMDEFIRFWHRSVIRWKLQVRDVAPQNRAVWLQDDANLPAKVSGIGDLVIGVQKGVSDDIRASVALKLPTGSSGKLLGSGALDIGVALDGAMRIAPKWWLGGQVALIHQGKTNVLPRTQRWSHQLSFGVMYQPNSRDTWIVQWGQEGIPFRSGDPNLDRLHRLGTYGYRRKLSDRESLTFYISEDGDFGPALLPHATTTGPDFTFGISYRLMSEVVCDPF